MNAQGVGGEVEDRYLASWVSENNKNTGMNAVFDNAYPRMSTTILYLIQICIEIFFPPSYVVTKLTYSHRSFMSKYS